MKQTRPTLLLAMGLFAFAACKKESLPTSTDNDVPAPVLAQIKSLGFATQGAQKVANGYLVEGDILLSEQDLASAPSSPNLVVAQEEQYRTFNLVSPTKHPTVYVALNNSSSQHQNAFSAALDEAIARYNAENLSVRFQRVTSGADINVVAFYENSNVLGSAGFPTATGDPYNEVRMNTYHYATGTDATNVNYIATIIAHEVGHCIGFRHTDYKNRTYSCGFSFPWNEGQTTTGVGAVHIPGTPTGGDPNSWMLACVGKGVNRPFNTNDKVALGYVY